ncbi:hypothetical protein SPBR_07934 [Sporothrix brasiliensis 5110]|uniref:Uncharacterized protein n=1 Tax=Sporothrix brasiliensis 5110 TaxID=1398154 RepID=A0A0C2FCN7_9PEZI|nr:uncharacterized protein SPBR_07934 [Sporothrix brasiliensis 5110]KIH88888.1 hypothetical protein SPBR_07934 [Sporothrix brasiliensis 5110]
MLVLQCSMDRTSASKSTQHEPMTTSRAETEAEANIDCDHMSDSDSVLCHDPEDNHAGSDVDEADADNMSEDDAPVMEGSADMTNIPLGDPVEDLVLREYDTLAEFDGEANSDDGFDVPSPSEIEPQAPEEAERRLVFGNRIDNMLAAAANLPWSYLDPSSFRSRRWLL